MGKLEYDYLCRMPAILQRIADNLERIAKSMEQSLLSGAQIQPLEKAALEMAEETKSRPLER